MIKAKGVHLRCLFVFFELALLFIAPKPERPYMACHVFN